MKNTTTITSILKNFASNKLTIDEATSELQSIINTYSSVRANPSILDSDGNLVAKWCSKHKQYELSTTFPRNTRSKDGLYSHCRYAEKRAKSYSAKIQKLKDNYFKTSKDAEQKSIKAEIAEIDRVKNDYKFETDAPTEIISAQVKFEKSYKKQIAELIV